MNREYFEKLIEVRDVIGELYELMQDVAKEAPNPLCYNKAMALVDIISDLDDLVDVYGSMVVLTRERELTSEEADMEGGIKPWKKK